MITYIRHIFERIREGALKEIFNEILWVWRYSLRYRKAVFWNIFLGVFGTALGLGSSVVSKYIIDAVTGYDSAGIIPAAIGYVSMNLFTIGSNALTGRISAKIQISVNQEIRSDVFGKIMLADWEAMSGYHTGDLLNRLNGDVNTISNSVLGWIPNLITRSVQFFGALGIILYYDPTLALLALLSAPVTLLMSRMLMSKMRSYNVKMREVSSEMMSFNDEAFQNMQYIKSFGLAGRYGQRFEEKQNRYRDVQLEYNKFSILTSSTMSLVGTIVSCVCFGWGVYRLWTGAITYGTMTLFLQMAGSLSAAFSSLVSLVPEMISAATAAGRVMAVTTLPPEDPGDVEEAVAFREYARGTEGITVCLEHVTFAYQDKKEVLKDVSLCASPREVVALVGPSGEGKTTLLRILLGLVNVQQGKITLEAGGKQLPAGASSRILYAYVPQGNTMMSGTIAENLRLLNETATDQELWEVLREVCADEFVRELPEGLNASLRERGVGLSEGQLQRLSIARALLCNAPVLLLDEATSALDVATERKLLRNIMHSERNKTCIVTTHRPSVLSMCNRVYRVRDMRVEQLDEAQIDKIVREF